MPWEIGLRFVNLVCLEEQFSIYEQNSSTSFWKKKIGFSEMYDEGGVEVINAASCENMLWKLSSCAAKYLIFLRYHMESWFLLIIIRAMFSIQLKYAYLY